MGERERRRQKEKEREVKRALTKDPESDEYLESLTNRLPLNTASHLVKYGVSLTDLIRMARGLPADCVDLDAGLPADRTPFPNEKGCVNKFAGSSSSKGLGGGNSRRGTNNNRSANLSDLNMVRETQVSLLAYSHILQGRYIDVVCLLIHKYLIGDLHEKLKTGFSMLSCQVSELQLDQYMESDPVAMETRRKLQTSIDRLKKALKKLGSVSALETPGE